MGYLAKWKLCHMPAILTKMTDRYMVTVMFFKIKTNNLFTGVIWVNKYFLFLKVSSFFLENQASTRTKLYFNLPCGKQIICCKVNNKYKSSIERKSWEKVFGLSKTQSQNFDQIEKESRISGTFSTKLESVFGFQYFDNSK